VSQASGPVAAFVEATLHVRPGEGRRTALLFTHLLLASAVFILGRTVRDTLFLSRYPLRALPWMFVLYGLASAITVIAYARVADRFPRHRVIVASTGIGIATYLAVWGLVRAQANWVYPVFYVWSEVVANLFIVQFWTLANDLHDARSAKRLFGPIGSARVLGVVLVGLGAGGVVKAIGTAQLLFVLAGLMAAIAGLAIVISREPKPEFGQRAGAEPVRRGPPPKIFGDPYVRTLSIFILLTFTALTLGDYQFKAIARATYTEDALARFFSLFYAGTGAVSFLFQVLVTPRLLARLGVGWGMSVMPTVFGAASALLLVFPKLAVATVMKFADNGFQYTIHDTTLQALYVPFPMAVKARTRAFLDAVVKPLSYGLGGLALVVVVPLVPAGGVQLLSLLTVAIVAAWLAIIPLTRRRYLRTLEGTLSARGVLALEQEQVLDSAGRKALVRALDEGEPRRVLVALEQMAGERDRGFVRAVEKLARHADATVRAAALRELPGHADADAAAAEEALSDRDPDVRAAAATAFATLAHDDAVDRLAPCLDDPSPDVRVAALAGLLRHGGLEGDIVGGARLGRMLASPSREERVEAARTLSTLGLEAYRPLRRLLADPDPAVRRAALKAAPGVADPRLVPALVDALMDPSTRRRAGAALVAVGTPAVTPLIVVLADESVPRAVRLLVPRILRHIPAEATYAMLRPLTAERDSFLRLRTFAALSRLRQSLRRGPEPLRTIQAMVEAELLETYRNQSGWLRARPAFETPLLVEIFEFRQERAMRRILRILELRYDPAPLGLVREHLLEPKRRANSIEVLDTVLDPSLRPLVMPFLDDIPVEERLRHAAVPIPPPPEPLAFIREHCRHPNPYVVMVALDALARHGAAEAADEARPALAHHEPLIREAALHALAMVQGAAANPLIRPLTTDPDPVVALHAQAILARHDGTAPLEVPMFSTVEKVLFLKSAPVFSRLAGEDLAPLARMAEVCSFAKGERIFTEGEMGDALYVVVRGSVAILRGHTRLAILGVGEAFGEMAVLEEVPRSATSEAAEESEVLRIGSEEFYEMLHEQVEIAEGVIRMLSNRLREADTQIKEMRRSMGIQAIPEPAADG
jgi:ATP/ADP translocase/HEAT repeat protein